MVSERKEEWPYLDEIDFKSKTATGERLYIMIKGQFIRKIALINICVPNIRPLKSMKQILTELKKKQ